jgi:hypothetical protein
MKAWSSAILPGGVARWLAIAPAQAATTGATLVGDFTYSKAKALKLSSSYSCKYLSLTSDSVFSLIKLRVYELCHGLTATS